MDLLDGLFKIAEYVDNTNEFAETELGNQAQELLTEITSLVQAGLLPNPELDYQEPEEDEDY